MNRPIGRRAVRWASLLDLTAEVMKAIVDADRCEGNALCMSAAPELFELDDNERARVLLDGVPASMEQAARQAADACPRMAITLED